MTARRAVEQGRELGGWVYDGVEFHYAALRQRVVPHFHDEYQIAVIIEGGLELDAAAGRHCLDQFAIGAINPGEVHSGRGDDAGWKARNFYVPPAFVASLDLDPEVDCLTSPVIRDRELALALVRAHGASRGASALVADTLLASAFGELFSRYAARRHVAPKLGGRDATRRAVDYIHAHVGDSIRLKTLAHVAGLSAYHFLRTFARDTGLTPHAYQNQLRVTQAWRRLSGGASAADLAAELGFSDQSHLIRSIKRTLGLTPSLLQGAE